MRFALLPLVLLVPLAGMVLLRRAALRAPPETPGAWFSFWRRSQMVMTVTWMGWPAGMWLAGTSSWLSAVLRPYGLAAVASGLSLAYLAPPAIAGIAIAGLAHAVQRRLRGTELTTGEAVRIAAWQNAAIVVPLTLVTLAVTAAMAGHYRVAAGAGLASLIAALIIGRGRATAFQLAPHAITSGELRDRLFALARACNVTVRQLYVVPAARMRIANAFAVRGQMVVLTDTLLTNLSRREVDAVLAHELIHLQQGHPSRLLLLPVGATLLVWWSSLVAPPWVVWPASIAVGSVVLFAVSRHFERVADRGAVALTRDPEALISALACISRLNHMPLEWSGWSEHLLTHPSTRRRALAIAGANGLHRARVDALLRDGLMDPTHYPVPEAVTGPGKVFSSTLKSGWALRMVGLFSLAFVAAPATVFALAPWMPPVPRFLLVLWALGLAIVLSLAMVDVAAVRPYAGLRRRLGEGARGRGLDPGREGTVFVGLAPGRATRVYEGFGDWDIGFLGADVRRLVYLGEEAHFVLRRDQVTNVRVMGGLPGWLRAPRVLIEWHADDGREGALQLRPAEVTRILQAGSAAEALFEKLTGWWVDGTALGSAPEWLGAEVGPPPGGDVTGTPPAQHVGALIPQGAMMLLLSAMTSALLGLRFWPFAGPGFADLFLVAMLAVIFYRIPLWRWREPAPEREAVPERRAA